MSFILSSIIEKKRTYAARGMKFPAGFAGKERVVSGLVSSAFRVSVILLLA
jgi:hypothetical protein